MLIGQSYETNAWGQLLSTAPPERTWKTTASPDLVFNTLSVLVPASANEKTVLWGELVNLIGDLAAPNEHSMLKSPAVSVEFALLSAEEVPAPTAEVSGLYKTQF